MQLHEMYKLWNKHHFAYKHCAESFLFKVVLCKTEVRYLFFSGKKKKRKLDALNKSSKETI